MHNNNNNRQLLHFFNQILFDSSKYKQQHSMLNQNLNSMEIKYIK